MPAPCSRTSPHAALASGYLAALLRFDRPAANALVRAAREQGIPIREIYLHVFQPVLREVGRLWQTSQISVAMEHYCTAATQVFMSEFYPQIFDTPKIGRRLVAACVGEELHEIGIRMVCDFFEMDGWNTIYLGANTPPAGILSLLGQQKVDVLAISTTITIHLGQVTDLIARVRSSGSPVKILVGGYPFNVSPELWRSVGADGFAPDARLAIATANSLLANG
jgi:methanogenic corrinoid protein MtbC1